MDLDLTPMRVAVTDHVAEVTIAHPSINLLDQAMLVDLALEVRFDVALAAGAQTRAGELRLRELLDGLPG